MEVQSDHGLLVVSLENCMTSDTSCDLTKSNSCIYTPAMTNDACGHETSVVQLAAPIQCISDIRQTLPRIQHQHVTQLQPIQYSQTISFEPNHQLHHSSLVSNHTLYQPMTVSTAPLHHYTAANHTLHNPYMNNPSLPILTPSPSLPNPAPVMDDVTSTDPADPPLIRSDSLLEPTYPAEGFDYFLEIQNYLASEQYPPGVSDNYKKCLKKRAQNYLIIDGKLHHNRKYPKEVIMRKDQQEDMLSDIHIVKESGVHLGVKKMFTKLQMKFFWRGMYTDVVNFVKKCDKCSDQLISLGNQRPTFSREEEEEEGESEDLEAVEDPAPLLPSSPTPPRFRSLRNKTNIPVWRKVEVQIHGPYNKTCVGNEFVMTMSDPASRWCCAAAISAADHPTLLADFVFHSFCNYGFARCSLVGCSPGLCDAVIEEYMTKVSRLGEMFASTRLGRLEKHQSRCSWVHPLLDRLVDAHPTKWDRYLDHFLFQYRIGELKDLAPFTADSPFSLLFSHSPLSFAAPEEDKENIDGSNQSYQLRKRKPNSSMQCKHCDSLFTSKISFHIHQRKHFGAVGHRKHLLGRKRIVKPKNDVNSLSVHPDLQPSTTWKESTVSAVKAFLVATKEERRRRGKYHKYPLEVQEQMAAYAVTHGNTQAVRHFSERLGTMVSESTIRNLVKLHNGFTPAMKQEIGWYAVNYGVQSAAKYFSQWLKRDVPQSLVRKFVQIFLAKQPNSVKKPRSSKTNLGTKNSANNVVSCKSKRYTTKMKEEIGEYACSHSIKETATYFSEKLKMLVKERTVIRFNKFYTDKFKSKSDSVIMEPTNQISGTTQVSVYNTFQQVQNTPVTLYHLSPSMHTSNAGTTVCFQSNTSPSVITSQNNSAIGYHTVQNFSSLSSVPMSATQYPVALLRPEKADLSNIPATQHNQQTQTCLIHQNGLIVSQNQDEPGLPHFMATAQPLQQAILTVVTKKDSTDIQNQIIDDGQNLNTSHDLSGTLEVETFPPEIIQTAVTDLFIEQDKLQATERQRLEKINISEESKTKEISKAKKTFPKKQVSKKKEKGPNKRGKYTAYSPEIRAEIGKYAAEHGSLKACQHFAKLLGHEVPESTARGLREKYLMKKEHCPVTSLGYSQRGRPLRLGKYDGIVQECLKDIVRSGEKVSSFLAITTAKEILNKYEPELLEENGGSLKLNTTWAKSFLKRIGVHNNS